MTPMRDLQYDVNLAIVIGSFPLLGKKKKRQIAAVVRMRYDLNMFNSKPLNAHIMVCVEKILNFLSLLLQSQIVIYLQKK